MRFCLASLRHTLTQRIALSKRRAISTIRAEPAVDTSRSTTVSEGSKRSMSEHTHQDVSELLNAFANPESPFYLAPGEVGPSDPSPLMTQAALATPSHLWHSVKILRQALANSPDIDRPDTDRVHASTTELNAQDPLHVEIIDRAKKYLARPRVASGMTDGFTHAIHDWQVLDLVTFRV